MRSRLERWFPFSALQNVSLLTAGKFVTYGTGFLYGVLGARILGPFRLGQLVLVISIVRIIMKPFDLQLGGPLVKMLRRDMERGRKKEIRRVLSGALVMQVGSMVLFGLIFALFLLILPPYWPLFEDWQIAMSLFAMSEILLRSRIFIPYFQAAESFRIMAVYSSLVATFRNFIPVIFMYWGVEGACAGYLFAECLLVVLSLGIVAWYRGTVPYRGFVMRPSEIQDMFETIFYEGRSNYLASVFQSVYEKAQKLIIGQFIGSTEVAYFDIGKKGNQIFRFFASSLRSYLFPRFIGKWETDRQEFFYTLRKYFYQVTPAFLVLAGLIVATAPWFIPWIYGADYAPAVVVVFILVPAVALNFVLYIFRSLVFATSEQRELLNMNLIRLVLGLSLLFPLTIYYSYIGTAWAIALTTLVLLVYQLRFLFRKFGWRWILPEHDR